MRDFEEKEVETQITAAQKAVLQESRFQQRKVERSLHPVLGRSHSGTHADAGKYESVHKRDASVLLRIRAGQGDRIPSEDDNTLDQERSTAAILREAGYKEVFRQYRQKQAESVTQTKIKDKDSLWAFDQIIDAAPSACPVGFYTSPWIANLYLEKLDWYIEQNLYKIRRGKRVKYVTHHLRYVDDILLFGTSKSDLKKAVKQIKEYLKINYDLEIKPCWEIKRIGKHDKDSGKLIKGTYWLDIGGYKFCKDATILRDGIYLSAKRLARKMYKAGYYTVHQAQSIISRIGWAKHSDARRFMQECILPYVNIKEARRVISYVGKIQKQRS